MAQSQIGERSIKCACHSTKHELGSDICSSIFNVGDTVYVRTNKDADNFRIAHFDITQESVVLKDVVPEHVGQMMTMALPIKGNLMALVYHWEVRRGVLDANSALAYFS